MATAAKQKKEGPKAIPKPKRERDTKAATPAAISEAGNLFTLVFANMEAIGKAGSFVSAKAVARFTGQAQRINRQLERALTRKSAEQRAQESVEKKKFKALKRAEEKFNKAREAFNETRKAQGLAPVEN